MLMQLLLVVALTEDALMNASLVVSMQIAIAASKEIRTLSHDRDVIFSILNGSATDVEDTVREKGSIWILLSFGRS